MLFSILRKRPLWTLFRLFFLGGVLCLLVSCASQEVSKEDPEVLFASAEQAFEAGDYLVALERYREVKNRFPYSGKAVEAELRIADTYYAQESFIEAEGSYEVFKELHPNYKADYVQFRIGMSYARQIPGNIARDLSAAHKAVEAFQEFEQKYSKSPLLEKTRNALKDAKHKLAEHENYVANFYFQRQHYLSSSYRYASLLRHYPKLGFDEEALYRLGQCYYHIRMHDNARDALGQLLKEYPESEYKTQARALLSQLSKVN